MLLIFNKIINKFIRYTIIILIIFSWIFSGFPQIFNFPPKIKEAKAATSAFLDGAAVTIGTTETTIGSLATNLPAGDNLIIVVFQFDATQAAAVRTISAGNLRLKRAGVTLASNEFLIRADGGTAGKKQVATMLVYRDAGAPANPTYEVTAQADGAGSQGEVKILVINNPPASSFADGVSVQIGTAETTILTHSPNLPAGDNIVIAIFQADNNSNGGRTISAGNLKLKRGTQVLSSNQNAIVLEIASGAIRSMGYMLIARDVGAPANPTYTVTALASAAGVNGEAKIIVLQGLNSEFLDTPNVPIGTSETIIGTLNTTLPAGGNVIIAGIDTINTVNAVRTINADNIRLKTGGVTQSSNQFNFEYGASGSSFRMRGFGLLWRHPSAPANASYQVTALASGTGISGETKLLVISLAMPTFTQSAYRFFNNLDSTDVGTPLAAQDTPATLSSPGAAFRLRMLLHIGNNQLAINGQEFKLQFAQRGADNLCDTGFSGETYVDVTTSTVIAYNDNPTPADGVALTANVNDPTHGADTIVNQTYEELNNFTNSVAAIPSGQDGKWDFSLKDNGALANTTYCFRIVKSDDTFLDGYLVIPQIITAALSISCSVSATTTNFSDLSPSSVSTSSPNINLTITSPAGFQVTINDAGNGSNPGLYKSTAPSYLITSADLLLTAGSDGYGIQATTTNPSININPKYNKSGNNVGGLTLTPQVLATSSIAVSNQVITIIHKAAVSFIAPAGSYSDTITYSCSAL